MILYHVRRTPSSKWPNQVRAARRCNKPDKLGGTGCTASAAGTNDPTEAEAVKTKVTERSDRDEPDTQEAPENLQV